MNSNNNTNFINSKEEKVLEGVYITRNNKSKESLVINETNLDANKHIPNKCKYVYRSTAELIAILENDFEQIFKEIQMLYEANEDMIEYDPHDYDLIQAREENLIIINKKLNELMDIQAELRQHCPTNPLVTKNIFDFFNPVQELEGKEDYDKNNKEKGNNNLNQTTSNVNEINSNVDTNYIGKNQDEIITNIEL